MTPGKIPAREEVWLAVFALLKTIGPIMFNTYDRRILPAPEYAPKIQPALLLCELGDDVQRQQALAKQIWHGIIVGYARKPDNNKALAGITIINPMIDAVMNILNPDISLGSLQQTLGGLVSECWVEGEIIKNTGDTDEDGQAKFSIPIRILVP